MYTPSTLFVPVLGEEEQVWWRETHHMKTGRNGHGCTNKVAGYDTSDRCTYSDKGSRCVDIVSYDKKHILQIDIKMD